MALAWASLMTPFHDGMLMTPGFLLMMLPSFRTVVIWAALWNASDGSRKALLSAGMVSSPPTFSRLGTPPTPLGAWQRTQAKAT